MPLKSLRIAAKWLFVLCLPLLLISAGLAGAFNSLWLYKFGFAKYEVDQTTGLAEAEMEKAAAGLISYFNSGEEDINLSVIKDSQPFTLFNEREVGHLRDVKGLVRLDYRILLATLLYAIGFTGLSLFWWKDWRLLARGAMWGGGLTLALMAVLRVVTLYSFDQFFRQFHLLSFTNDLWMLDPSKDYLIMLFPSGFWYDATQFIALGVGTAAVLITGLAWAFGRRRVAT
jgi:integral membrane protein (TIGR01906 family)